MSERDVEIIVIDQQLKWKPQELALTVARMASEANRGDRRRAAWRKVLRTLDGSDDAERRDKNRLREKLMAQGAAIVLPPLRRVLPVCEGDRPADLTDQQIATAECVDPEYRNRSCTPDQRALVVREWFYDRGRGDGYGISIRETHREVHESLAGEPTPSCPWCIKSKK